MGDLALVHQEATRGLAQANPQDDADLRYIHVYDEPDGVVSYTEWLKQKNAEHGHANKFCSGRLFVSVQTGEDLRQRLEEELRRLIHRDNQFTDIDSVEKFLDSTVYALSEAPRMMHLPQQSVSAVMQADKTDPDVLRWLSRCVMGQFLGNAYSMDWERMVGVGERLDLPRLYEKFPDACKALFGDINDPANVKQLSIGRHDEDRIHRIFYSHMTDKDIPALLELLDGDIANTYASDIVQGEWDKFASNYDGVSYTDRVNNLDGTVKDTWPVNEVHRDWAGPRAVKLGTVMDLIKQGQIKWPGLRQGTEEPAWKHPLSALRRAWSGPNAEEKSMEKYYADLAELLRSEYGMTLPSPSDAGPKQLPAGP